MTYHQITSEERYILAALRKQGFSQAEVARALKRHPSTISRELTRNCAPRTGYYRPSKAIEMTNGRRSRSRRNQRFSRSDLRRVETLLRQQWSPEQISGHLRREIDTVIGKGSLHCLLTIVDRKSGYLLVGKLKARTKQHTNQRTLQLIARHTKCFKTITADNGTEFHDYAAIERDHRVKYYFATPHHSWERGTNKNTNGLIRQYVPKGTSMAKLTQYECNAIAKRINVRPRKRLGYKTPEECFSAI